MVKRHLIQSSVLVAGILSASLGLAEPPALKTVWLRFEDKEAGKQVILADNSSSSAEAQAEGVSIDPAKPAPVYVDFKPPQGRFKIIDGETGQEYDNDRACKVEQAGTCGAGYIEIRNVVFAINPAI